MKKINVKGYHRKDGNRVKPHTRVVTSRKKVPSYLGHYKSGNYPLAGEIITTRPVENRAHGYTTKTSIGTLWRPLPDNYLLKGEIVSKLGDNYHGKRAIRLVMERTSPSPKGQRLRKEYLIWYTFDDEKLHY